MEAVLHLRERKIWDGRRVPYDQGQVRDQVGHDPGVGAQCRQDAAPRLAQFRVAIHEEVVNEAREGDDPGGVGGVRVQRVELAFDKVAPLGGDRVMDLADQGRRFGGWRVGPPGFTVVRISAMEGLIFFVAHRFLMVTASAACRSRRP